jgi:tRNA1(Val) A37 N6-methylase TrmN6
VLPVYPKPDAVPVRVLVRAIKDVAARREDVAGLTLNDTAGRPTAAAEAILRGGQTLALAEID